MNIDTNIISSSYGKEIKDGIVNSVISIDGYENITDISTELNTINSNIYGESIRHAVYNVLEKVFFFAEPWVGTKNEYDNIQEKQNNKLYLILKE